MGKYPLVRVLNLLKQVATHPNKFGTPFFHKEKGQG
jgi:hypothetical protein